MNSFEYKNSCISNFPHLNLSFQQLESQFSIFNYGWEMYEFLLFSVIRLTEKGLFVKQD